MFNTGSSRNTSTVVALKDIDAETNNNIQFPRLSDLPRKTDDPSKFLIKITHHRGITSLLEVCESDTIGEIKRQATRPLRGIEGSRLELAGRSLKDKKTVLKCGILPGAKLSLVLPEGFDYGRDTKKRVEDTSEEDTDRAAEELAPRGANVPSEVEKRYLINKARARTLYGWDGLMSNGEKLGLPLQPETTVMIGRVINQDWYEGYLPNRLDKYGYIPRTFVNLECLYDEGFRKELGSVGKNLPLSPSQPSRPRRRRRDRFYMFVNPLIDLFSPRAPKWSRSKATASVRNQGVKPTPCIPPPPFPEKPLVPTLDILEQGTRVRLNFHLVHRDTDEYPMITAVLSLVSAPQTRISYATIELEFEHDTIVELEPKWKEAPHTEVAYSNSVTNELSAKGGANQGPVGVNIKGSHTVSKVAEFLRRTKGTVVGDGEGSSRAYWVFKEDPGEAGRCGLDSEQRMMVKLHARPVRIDYQVNVKVMADDGGTGGWFGTKRLSSGRQRFYLR